MVENHGNTVASCRLHLVDPTDRVDGDFDPPAVGVAPGAATLVRLKARAARGGFRRRPERSTSRSKPAVRGSLRSRRRCRSCSRPRFLAPCSAGSLRSSGSSPRLRSPGSSWSSRRSTTPQPIRSTASSRRPSESTADGGVDVPTRQCRRALRGRRRPRPSATSTLPPPRGRRAAHQTADQSTTLAEGGVFDLTDIRVENPYNDRGIATLLVNSEPLFIWSLDNIRGRSSSRGSPRSDSPPATTSRSRSVRRDRRHHPDDVHERVNIVGRTIADQPADRRDRVRATAGPSPPRPKPGRPHRARLLDHRIERDRRRRRHRRPARRPCGSPPRSVDRSGSAPGTLPSRC